MTNYTLFTETGVKGINVNVKTSNVCISSKTKEILYAAESFDVKGNFFWVYSTTPDMENIKYIESQKTGIVEKCNRHGKIYNYKS